MIINRIIEIKIYCNKLFISIKELTRSVILKRCALVRIERRLYFFYMLIIEN